MGQEGNRKNNRKDGIVTTVFAFIVLLGILIFVHELGHFLAARAAGVGVLKFSLGFGPSIFGKKIGETEYVLAWIPLGGFVKLLGESGDEELPPEDAKRSFNNQAVWKKMLIVLAGPAFNFVLAILIFIFVQIVGFPSPTSEIGKVAENSAASEAGLAIGDKIVSMNGEKIVFWEDVIGVISQYKDKEIKITVERNGQEKQFVVKPRLTKVKNIFGEEVSDYLIGISPSDKTMTDRRNPWDAIITSFYKTWDVSRITVVAVYKMLQGVLSPKNLGGPIFIAKAAGVQMQKGAIEFLFLIAVISINLGVLNLFPIPVLDGGHVFFYLIEMVTRREISPKVREMAQQIGFVFLVMLMLFVIFIDIERLNIKFINDILKIFK
jgi:regulator of sigma E protease